MTDAQGNTSFVPVVPFNDPDLTVYEDVSQVLLTGSQEPVRKFNTVLPSVNSEVDATTENINDEDDENNAMHEPFKLLDPEDVSRTFSELQGNNSEPNCSAIIDAKQVNSF